MSRLFSAVRLMRHVPSLSFALLVVGIALSPFAAFRVYRGGAVAACDPFLMAAAVLLVYGALRGRTKLWASVPHVLGACTMLFGFGAWIILHGGIVPHENLVGFLIVFYSAFLVPVVIASQSVHDIGQVRTLIYVHVAANVIGAAIAVCQARGIELPWIQSDLVWNASRVAGLTRHPNTLGFFVSLAVPLCFAHGLAARRWLVAGMWIACLSVLFYAIDKTGSRTALAASGSGCLIVAALFVLMRSRSRFLRVTMISVAGLVAALTLMGGGESALSRLLGETESARLADMGRQGLLQAMYGAFSANPMLGDGYIFFGLHDVIMATLAMGGVVGLFAQVLREWAVLRHVLGLLRALPQLRTDFATGAGLLATYAVWLLSTARNYQLLDRPGFIALGLLVLFSLKLREHVRVVHETPPPVLGARLASQR